MKNSLDKGLLLAVLFLVGLGLVQVYSSSFIYAIESYGDGLYFFRKQLVFAVFAIVILLGFAKMPWKWASRIALALWVVAVIGIGLPFLPGVGLKVGGAYRWIRLPFNQRFEPAELLRVTYPVVLAFLLTYRRGRLGVLDSPLRLLVVATPLILVLQQPDFGTFVICSLLGLVLLFTNGLRWRYVLGGAMSLVIAAYFLIVHTPYRQARLKAFMDPWSDPAEKGFQVIQSMLSFHSGGLSGVGLGQGQGKLFFLPEAHTDFTLAVLGEEVGFLGYAAVLMILGFIVFRGTQVAMRAREGFDRLVALGITASLALAVFINVGVVTGMLPTKGLTFPFLSYGGSSLIATGLALGLLLNLERRGRTT